MLNFPPIETCVTTMKKEDVVEWRKQYFSTFSLFREEMSENLHLMDLQVRSLNAPGYKNASKKQKELGIRVNHVLEKGDSDFHSSEYIDFSELFSNYFVTQETSLAYSNMTRSPVFSTNNRFFLDELETKSYLVRLVTEEEYEQQKEQEDANGTKRKL